MIVVGVDGSDGSVVALRWALAEARLRGSSVRVVHAYQSPLLPLLGMPGDMGAAAAVARDSEQVRRAAQEEARNLIGETVRRAGGDAFEAVEIERAAIEGAAAQTLIDSARDAELLVVGSRGRGGFIGLLLGSVSQQCAHHPPCPVVILPPPEPAEPGSHV